MLAPGRNRAQFLTANRNTHVLGRTPSYNLRSRRATADPLYVVSTRTELQKPAWCAMNNVISLPGRIYDSTVALPGHGRSIENPTIWKPAFTECSPPAMFAMGLSSDASAVGEGAMAVTLVHRYLASP